MKPATKKARLLLAKLEALAERGVDGEAESALRKLDKLRKRFDFTAPEEKIEADLFSGAFRREYGAGQAVGAPQSQDVANAAKWAIESLAGVPCHFRGRDLVAEATTDTARRLAEIVNRIATDFERLWTAFAAVPGVNLGERHLFMAGLTDGMLGETRAQGQRLPARVVVKVRKVKAGKRAVAIAPGLAIHPYTVATGLGRQVRFSVPVGDIEGELERVVQGAIGEGVAT